MTAADVFDAVQKGVIKPSTWKIFPLADASEAHAALQGGKSAGAIVLRP
jgi:NADPH2:quinone reductase